MPSAGNADNDNNDYDNDDDDADDVDDDDDNDADDDDVDDFLLQGKEPPGVLLEPAPTAPERSSSGSSFSITSSCS